MHTFNVLTEPTELVWKGTPADASRMLYLLIVKCRVCTSPYRRHLPQMKEPRCDKREVDQLSLTHQTHTRVSTHACQVTRGIMWYQQNPQLHVKKLFLPPELCSSCILNMWRGQMWDKCQTGKGANKHSTEGENARQALTRLTMRWENAFHRAAGSHGFPPTDRRTVLNCKIWKRTTMSTTLTKGKRVLAAP